MVQQVEQAVRAAETVRQGLLGLAITAAGLLLVGGVGIIGTTQANGADRFEVATRAADDGSGSGRLIAIGTGSTETLAPSSDDTGTGPPAGLPHAPSTMAGPGVPPSDGTGSLDSAAAVAAAVDVGPAASDLDRALVALDAEQRSSGRAVQTGLTSAHQTLLAQEQRSSGQSQEARGIATEQARLLEEQRLAEEQREAEEEAARARLQALEAGTPAGGPDLPVGTLLPRDLARSVGLEAISRSGARGAQAVAPITAGSYSVAARFGAVGLWSSYHTGVDLAAPVGTPVRAVADGRVTAPLAGGWAGVHVVVDHGDGSTLSAHLLQASVAPGQTVRAGDVIGFVGMTGRTFGPHLHFEYYPAGSSVSSPYGATDPVPWLARRGVGL